MTIALTNAQAETTTDFPDSKWAEVNSIIDEVKSQNSPQNLRLTGSLGLISLQSNTPDSVKLGSGNSVVAIGLTAVANIWNHFGLEAKVLHGRNLIPADGSPNTAGASITWIDVGPRYTLYLDSSKLDNYLAFKILYHQNDSDFKLVPADPNSIPFPIFMTHYAGVSGSVERSIPISKRLGVLASFDLLQIFQASAPTSTSAIPIGFAQSGYGFEVKGEVYYQLEIQNSRMRLGVSYWQQGNENEFDNPTKILMSRNSYFQIARSVYLDLSLLF